jgi:hypothetical protein
MSDTGRFLETSGELELPVSGMTTFPDQHYEEGALATEVEARPTRSFRGFLSRSRWLFVFLAVLLSATLWFNRYRSHALMGDDLGTWLFWHDAGSWESGLHAALTDTSNSKYRPLSNLLSLASYYAFGDFYGGYKALNLVIEALNVTLFVGLVWLLSRSRVLTVGLAAVAVMARFDLYYVMQGFGAEEGLALTFLLLGLLSARRGLRGETRGLLGANLAYTGAVYAYEGMLGMGVALVLLPLVASRRSAWRDDLAWRLGWALAPIAVVASNLAVKSALGVHFLTGTGGTKIALKPSTVFGFFREGVQTLMGFSTGPAYLSGASWDQLPGPKGLLVGIGFSGAVLLLACATVWRIVVSRRANRSWPGGLAAIRVPLLGVALGVPLLATQCTTIRLEYRWLYPVYLVLLLGVAWALGCWKPRSQRLSARAGWTICCAALVAAGISVELAYRPYATNTYFFGAQAGADSVYRHVFVANRRRLADTTILIDTHGDPVLTNWILAGGRFFSLYADGRPLDVRLVPSVSAIRRQQHLRQKLQLLEWNGRDEVAPATIASRPRSGTGRG